MRSYAVLLMFMVALAGCDEAAQVWDGFGASPGSVEESGDGTEAAHEVLTPDDDTVRPRPRPGTEQPVQSGDWNRPLGKTIAGLGDPGRPGLWLETPLVSEAQQGVVTYKKASVPVSLLPTGGAAGSGSRLSVSAMKALGAPLTELIEVSVSAGRP